ncbi:ABC transporter ATP-binding protein [Massilia sp. TSP1-1-2]|uniref:ABC transporter ATP-binding protein n=1 Tax=unclassified Massilia TaxID=2609279 RepID=UPI003CF07A89
MNKPAISAQRLTVRHADATILDRITFDIPSGAVVGLVGRNGAGKSTLLRCLAGLQEPDSGASQLLGRASLDLDDATRARLGYVGQTPDLLEWMVVSDHLRLVGEAYPGWSLERCDVLAARFQLPLAGKVGELSGGDQQKMALVMALSHDPDLLLLDEPVASLDPLTRQEFMRAMFARGDACERTVMISSHVLTDLERVVSHVAFMRGGVLQLLDTWDAMLDYLRLVPAASAVDPAAIVSAPPRHASMIIDTRHAPSLAAAGKAMTLPELFAELNQ